MSNAARLAAGAIALVISSTASMGVARAQARLEPLTGSPFSFTLGGGSSQVPLLSSDGRHLYISSVGDQDIIALDVAADGTPSLLGRFPSPGPSLGGMALAPGGDLLYAIAAGRLDVLGVAPDASLTLLSDSPAGASPSLPLNGIAYVQAAGGDFLYVNDNASPNDVSAWRVEPGGGASFVASYPTGGSSGFVAGAGLVAAPTVAAHGQRLFVLNPSAKGSSVSATVSSFDVLPDGSLVAVPGSPFDLRTVSASIVLDPSGGVLYAGGGPGDVLSSPSSPTAPSPRWRTPP